MRLFIAIDLPKSTRRNLSQASRALRQNSDGGRYVLEANFHITLHFLGETNQLAPAVEAMAQSVRGIRPFSLHLTRFEVLGRDVGCLGVDGDTKELLALRESLECALFDRGFAREYKRFTPHITLARGIVQGPEQLARMQGLSWDSSFLVSGIRLYESVRDSGGVAYTPLHTQTF